MSPTLTDQNSFDQEEKTGEERLQSAVLARGEEDLFSRPNSRHYSLSERSGHFLPCPTGVVDDESHSGNARSRSCVHSTSDNGSIRIACVKRASRLSKPRRSELSVCVPAQPVEGVRRDLTKVEKRVPAGNGPDNHVQTVNGLQSTTITEPAGGKLVMMPLQQPVSPPVDHSSQRMTTADSNTSRNQGNTSQHTSQGHTSQGHTSQGHISQAHTSQGNTSQGHTSQGCCSSFSWASSCATEDCTLNPPSLRPSPVPDCGSSVSSNPDMVGRSGCITSPVPSPPSSYASCSTAGCTLVSSATGCCCACSPSVSHGLARAADPSQRLALSSASLVPGPKLRAPLDNTSRCSSTQSVIHTPDSKPSPAPHPSLAGSSGNQLPLTSSRSSSSAGNQCSYPLTSLDKDATSSGNPSVSLELPSRTDSSSSVDSVDSGVWSPSSPPSPPGTPFPTTSASPPPQPEPSTTATQQVDIPPTLAQAPRQLPALRHTDMCDTDLDRLGRSVRALQDACFYYQELDSDGARELLQDAPLGTYLVRDSSDSRFLFAITLKTERGPTSVRIRYQKGLFQMDCVSHMKKVLPRFETMLELLDFHTAICRHSQGGQYRWLETSTRKDLYVRLSTPRRHSPPALSHLARVTINRSLQDLHLPARSTDLLPLPATMKQFLRDYPYRV